MKHFLGILTIAAGLTVSAGASTLWDNGAPDNVIAGNMTFFRIADDFTLAGAGTAASIQFWIALSSPSNFNGSITYALYNDNAGALGTQIALNTVSGLTPVPTSNVLSGAPTFSVYAVSFNLVSPVPLGAGTFWLELHEGSSLTANDGTSTYWATSAQSGNARADPVPTVPTTGRGFELAFQIFDTTVPEPGSMALTSLGIGALVCFARRWRRV